MHTVRSSLLGCNAGVLRHQAKHGCSVVVLGRPGIEGLIISAGRTVMKLMLTLSRPRMLDTAAMMPGLSSWRTSST